MKILLNINISLRLTLLLISCLNFLNSTSQVLPAVNGYDNIVWNCSESELLDIIGIENFQKFHKNDSVVLIEYGININGLLFDFTYNFDKQKLTGIRESIAIDTLSSNYSLILGFIINEQLLYSEELGIPEMAVIEYTNTSANSNIYRNEFLEIEFLSYYQSDTLIIDKTLKIKTHVQL